jgi:hypothetical protein
MGSIGGVAEWLKATDCKSVLSEYEGSNPSPSTTKKWIELKQQVWRKFVKEQAGVAQW